MAWGISPVKPVGLEDFDRLTLALLVTPQIDVTPASHRFEEGQISICVPSSTTCPGGSLKKRVASPLRA